MLLASLLYGKPYNNYVLVYKNILHNFHSHIYNVYCEAPVKYDMYIGSTSSLDVDKPHTHTHTFNGPLSGTTPGEPVTEG